MDILAPISGVITDQEVTNAASVQAYSSPNPFTISDLTTVWIVCDVYENDMRNVRMGEIAEIKLNAFPDVVLNGRISNIGAILDPTIRTAKVRLEVLNPDEIMRPGMFATATFYSLEKKTYTSVPASAILHLHDRDWVFIPDAGKIPPNGSHRWRAVAERHARNSIRAAARASRSCPMRAPYKMPSTMSNAGLGGSREKR